MVYFITYGDKNFKKSKDRLIREAKKFGFDNTLAYSPDDLSESFINATKPYIYSNKGAGYWLWKAFILNDSFKRMSDGDILIYLDAGCEINMNGKERYYEYLKLLDENNGIVSFYIPNCYEYMYTNQITFDFFSIDKNSEIYNSEMLVGGILIFKKNEITSKLINEYYLIASKQPNLFTDQNSYSFDYRFKEHRHDQSIFSILRKKINTFKIIDETCTYKNNWNEINHTPFHAKRIKDIPVFYKIYNVVKRNITFILTRKKVV